MSSIVVLQMGNSFASYATGEGLNRQGAKSKMGKLLQVIKIDGKKLEFRAPLRVRDLLACYPNCYVGAFREATQPLPLGYKLKIGKTYYLLPSSADTSDVKQRKADAKRQIKVVISKQQLRRLLLNEISIGDVLFEDDKRACGAHDSSTAWTPTLASIPEVSESL
ncbi:hypothetical protein Nepgr_021561 [Nepenthes gracilis]|uniref:Uncharacterized protein n=1 Tax=Nepenthes gracilis TaxID=150966 RepID=A0AAD3SYX9_NEPGR|nr:hypothetical protein Nepgr_021561 [Nepenthes gracilis]